LRDPPRHFTALLFDVEDRRRLRDRRDVVPDSSRDSRPIARSRRASNGNDVASASSRSPHSQERALPIQRTTNGRDPSNARRGESPMASNVNWTNEAKERWQKARVDGWRSSLARWTTGVVLYLTVSGLAIFFLPFSLFAQHSVLVHTVIGIVFTIPVLAYLVSHVKTYWDYPLTHVKFTGWASGAIALVCMASGVVLTWEAEFGTRISYAWRLAHQLTTFGLVAFLAPHLVAVWLRERKPSAVAASETTPALVPSAAPLLATLRVHLRRAGYVCAGGLLLTAGVCAAFRPVGMKNDFPAGYEMDPYGSGPFAPSLAKTKSGGAYDSRSFAGSESCGTTGCHQQIYEEWQPSAHRYAAVDAGFQKIQSVMAAQNGPVSTRYCGGCHDPISLFSGTKNIGVDNLTALPGIHEGISCVSCHAIDQTDVKGNANYVVRQPDRYAFELRDGALAKNVSDFMLRAYPQHHVDSLSHRMFKTPEFCAACHKQFIDKEVNKVGWVQLQNQYDNWRTSRWNHPGEANKTLECRECHMPLVDSKDPAAGDTADYNRTADDHKHRSHRFLGANQYIPKVHDLPHANEHVALVEKWLKGQIEIPEIADRWTKGPAVPIEIVAPREAVAGKTLPVQVRIVNNKTGHDFPTGPLDIIQAWVELEAKDDAGKVVFHSGGVDERHFVDTGTFMFKAEPIDRYGNLIDRHNLWEMVGVRFKRSLYPGAADLASYEMPCPGVTATDSATATPPTSSAPRDEKVAVTVPADVVGKLHLHAELHYRKFDQYLLNFAFGEGAGLTAPITTLSTSDAEVPVRRAATE
jgi:hypothetical protein